MTRTLIAAVISSTLLASAARAGVLYDGASTPTTRMDQAPWSIFSTGTADGDTGEVYSKSAAGGVTTLNTTQLVTSPLHTGIKAGYVATSPGGLLPNANMLATLDETAGYKLNFNIAVTSETAGDAAAHPDFADRAGSSIILISSDLKGVELAFWQTQVWAQAATFTGQSTTTEKALVNTSTMAAYELDVQGGNYSLSRNGTFLFGGALKTYPALPLPATYAVPNSLFLGDDTTARSATTDIAFVSIGALPEPASLGMLAVGAMGLLGRRRRGV